MPAPIALFFLQYSVLRDVCIGAAKYSQETDKEHGADRNFSLHTHLE